VTNSRGEIFVNILIKTSGDRSTVELVILTPNTQYNNQTNQKPIRSNNDKDDDKDDDKYDDKYDDKN